MPIAFYGSPVLYPIEVVGERSMTIQHIMMCNPLASILQQARHALIDPTAPTAAEAIGGAPRLLIPTGILVFICVLGYFVFERSAAHIAEEL